MINFYINTFTNLSKKLLTGFVDTIPKPVNFSETPIPKAKHSGMGTLNYPTACCGVSYL